MTLKTSDFLDRLASVVQQAEAILGGNFQQTVPSSQECLGARSGRFSTYCATESLFLSGRHR